MAYLVTFFFIFYSAILVDVKRYKKLSYICIFITLSLLILIAGLRYRVGGDSLYYIDTYSFMPTLSTFKNVDFREGYGPLWYLFCAISKTISPNFVYLQIIHAFFVNISFFYVFKKRNQYVLSSLFVYFLFYYLYFNMEIMRESLAVCVFCFNMPNLVPKIKIKYYILCFIAIGFHFSAVVLLVFPLLIRLLKSDKRNLFLCLGAISILIIFFYIIPRHIDLLVKYIPFIALKLKSYSTLSMNNLLGILYYSFSFVAFYGIYLIATKNGLFSQNEKLIMKLLLLFLLLGSLNQGIMRIANYLIPCAIPYIVNTGYFLLRSKKSYNKSKLIFVSCIFLLSFQKIYYYWNDTSELAPHTRQYELWYPYESVINPVKHHNRELIYYNAMVNQTILRGK